jgi:hypothetical protein
LIDFSVPPRTPAAAIARFLALVPQRIRYELFNTPAWSPRALPGVGTIGNCSVALAWAFGLTMRTSDAAVIARNGGWLNSDGIIVDANSPGGLFDRVEVPRPGDFGAFGWRDGSAGHVWMIETVDPASGLVISVIDCSPGNGRRDSVRSHSPRGRMLAKGVTYGRLRRFSGGGSD